MVQHTSKLDASHASHSGACKVLSGALESNRLYPVRPQAIQFTVCHSISTLRNKNLIKLTVAVMLCFVLGRCSVTIWAESRISLLRLFGVLLFLSKQMLGWYAEAGHARSLPCSFYFIIHSYPIIGRFLLTVTENVLKYTANETVSYFVQ